MTLQKYFDKSNMNKKNSKKKSWRQKSHENIKIIYCLQLNKIKFVILQNKIATSVLYIILIIQARPNWTILYLYAVSVHE